MTYDRIAANATPDDLERDLLEAWRAERLFHRTLEATQDGEPFVFYEGPPTANGKPGIHHVFARTVKDLINRYHTMRGRSVTRIAGWDTHGLPVEIEVEKALQISGKPDIERFGVAEFNTRCRESVFRYKADWESLSERIGYWLDYERAYITYTNPYIETVWWLLKQLADRDLLYKGHKVLPYCIRCGTALSSHELAQGYAQHRSPSIYVLFRVVEGSAAAAATERPSGTAERQSGRAAGGRGERYLLVWTTTPWTLPSNVAIAVHPDCTYVEVNVDGRRVIVEKTIAQTKAIPGATHGKPLAEFEANAEYAGRDLVGWRYEQLLDAVPVDPARAFRVVPGEFVTNEEGTGLVHMAPAFGADDYATIQREGLAFVNPVDAAGRFAGTRFAEIEGRTVFEANEVIARRLQAEGKVFGRYEPRGYEHSYPFCWRCDAPLVYYARESWFVRTSAFKDRMITVNGEVDWHPAEVGAGRFGEWLENNVDWALSRDRYWGTPLPVWECDAAPNEHRVVVGGFAELAGYRGAPLPDDFDPHKPGVDGITFPCRSDACSGTMRRVPPVIDAWFDSGAMPFAQWHYPFEQREEFERHFPADFICEGLDQTRGWFYSLLAIAAGVCDAPAYRHVIVTGLVLDADGRKMSKRLGNVIDPVEVVRQFGADAVRLYLMAASQVWLEKRFDPDAVREVAAGFLNRLRHTYDFFALYAEDWTPEAGAPPLERRPVADRWILSRLDVLVATVRDAWSGYDPTVGVRAIVEFCDSDLSNWYVRINRPRFWAPDAAADPAALATLHEVLVTVCRLLAPAAPFLSDAIHRRLTGASVHLAPFPEAVGRHDAALDESMDVVRRLASLARAARERAGLKVRQPLAATRVAIPAALRGRVSDELLGLLAAEVNVRQVSVVASDESLVRLRGKPNFRSLGKVYGKDTPLAARAAERLSAEQLRALEDGKPQEVRENGRTFRYRPEDVLVQREVVTDWLVESDRGLVAAIDPHLTAELRREGIARELVHRIQRLRKEAGYDYVTRIALSISGDPEGLAAAEAFRGFIGAETLSRTVELGTDLSDADVRETVDLDGRIVVLSVRRLDAGDR
jgi:isoleucyl-tRNA synthetase